jgi:FkbM family methyltransferase
MHPEDTKLDTRYGIFELPDWKDDLIIKSLRKYGEWAEEEINIITQFIMRGSVVIDAGAFIGSHSRAFSHFAGPEGVVHAFEPQNSVFFYLEKNARQSEIKNIFCHNFALGSSNNSALIGDISYKNRGATRIISENYCMEDFNNPISIDIKRLDDLNIGRIDFIKADVEGMEFDVVSGAESKIEKYRPIIFIEVNSINNSYKFFSWSLEKKYQAYGVLNNAYNLKNFYNEKDNIFGSGKECGLLLIPNEKIDNYNNQIRICNLPEIKIIDDLALLLLHKPQYPHEILGNSDVARIIGFDYSPPRKEEIFSEITARLDSSNRRLAELEEALARGEADVSALQGELEERERRLAELEEALARGEADVSALQGELEEREHDLNSLRTSRSWRWTYPFRTMTSLGRKIYTRRKHSGKVSVNLEQGHEYYVFFNIDSIIVTEGNVGVSGWVFDVRSYIDNISLEVSGRDGNKYVVDLVCGLPSSDVHSNYSYTEFSKNCRFYGKFSAHLGVNLETNWKLILNNLDHTEISSVNFYPLPVYERWIEGTVTKDILYDNVKLAYDTNISVYIDHDMGGGANQYRLRDIDQKKMENKFTFTLTFTVDFGYRINIEAPEGKNHRFLIKNSDEFFSFLSKFYIKEMIVNNLVSYFDPISFLSKLNTYKKNNPHTIIRVMGHDYFMICPSWRLENWEGNFCGIPSYDDCKICMEKTNNEFLGLAPRISPEKWRNSWAEFLNLSDEIRFFSRASADLFLKAYPQLADRVEIVPHKIPPSHEFFPGHGGPNRLGRWTVASVGRIGPHKGSEVLVKMQQMVRERGLPIDFMVIGDFVDPRFSGKIKDTGSYNPDDLTKFLRDFEVSCVILPFRWPETFSYVTHEICAVGIPLVVPEIGAPPEKIVNYTRGLVTKPDIENIFQGMITILEKYAQYPWQGENL